MFKVGDKIMIKYWNELPNNGKEWNLSFFQEYEGKVGTLVSKYSSKGAIRIQLNDDRFLIDPEAIKSVFQLPEHLFQI